MGQDRLLSAVANDLGLDVRRVGPAVQLIDDGNTVPFIARYRKELTGTLDEEQLRQLVQRLGYRRHMEDRRDTVLRSLEEQGVLTGSLQAELTEADSLQRIEDLYRPFRPQRHTRAAVARDKGLQPLAELILHQPLAGSRSELAASFITEGVSSVKEAYDGARDIVAEIIANEPDVRAALRQLIRRRGQINVTVDDEAKDIKGVYQLYYSYFSGCSEMRPHQIMAINRGEREGVLKVDLEVAGAEALGIVGQRFPADPGSALEDDLIQARHDAYHRLLYPALVRELRRDLSDKADTHAIEVFATNLRSLLLQPPLRDQVVLGIDPGYRTGCKIAVVDETGKILATQTIYPDRHADQAKRILQNLVKKHRVTVIAIGNGTASRETETFVAGLISESRMNTKYTVVSEAGASVYSASPLARAELPGLDVTLRGAVSIARRIQDPLAELVKIEPKAIGVGLYQHDVDQKKLADALDAVVESTVNAVGADLNTASPALLGYISGIGPRMAERIVAFRDANGAFRDRQAVNNVPGFGPRTFEQAAGFLKIVGGDCLLDSTPIHPESYAVAEAVLDLLGVSIGGDNFRSEIEKIQEKMDLDELAALFHTGPQTLVDILDALIQPGRDPRDGLAGPVLRSDVLTMEDLSPGMHLHGVVRNVVDFGAFVDIGVKRNGLIHISRMGQGFVHNPHDKVAVGDVVDVEVIEVDSARGRISLELIE
ncbi:MAG: Tex family protein [Anaerolineae bacterium]|nr:Tex family protein [Anaerolineae bacterium]